MFNVAMFNNSAVGERRSKMLALPNPKPVEYCMSLRSFHKSC